MSPPYRIEADYDPGLVRAAAWTFARRRIVTDRGIQVGAAVVALIGVGGAWLSADPWFLALALSLPVLIVGLFVVVGLSHAAAAAKKLRALDSGRAAITLDDVGLAVTTRSGSMSLVWAAFDEVWAFPRFWIVTTATNAYFTLPVENFSPDALAFAREKLGDKLA